MRGPSRAPHGSAPATAKRRARQTTAPASFVRRLAAPADRWLALLVAAAALLLYWRTLAPSVATLFDDSLEFPLVAWRLAIAHPTGYPLYTLLAALAARLLPLGDVAFRVNALSALAAAGAVGWAFLAARALGQPRPAALGAALLLAISPTFWGQATIAEVYSLHLLLLAALVWAVVRWAAAPGTRAPLLSFFLLGLGLAHHRMMALWAPPLLALALWRAPWLRRPGPAWLRLAAVAAAPLLLYLYLPLRGHIGSLDGSYAPGLRGFACWVTACRYTAFLTADPLGAQRDALFGAGLLLREVGSAALVLALLGGAVLARHRTPGGLFLLAGGAVSAAFAAAYRVADIEVFWLPVVLVVALLAGGGLAVAGGWLGKRLGQPMLTHSLLLALLVAASLPRWQVAAALADRSDAWAIHDAGRDVLAQPLPEGATVVGILGEMTLLRYFQETEGLRPDLRTVAADRDAERLDVVARAVAAGERVFLTRPLAGAEERWSLSALGPLVEVLPTPRSSPAPGLWPRADEVGAGIRLVGWTVGPIPGHGPPQQRLTVAWQPTLPIPESLKISPRLRRADGSEVQGADGLPVRFAYPTTAWRPGEVVQDTYTLPVRPDAESALLIIYREADGREVGRVILPLPSP